jgi:hypothetical protein
MALLLAAAGLVHAPAPAQTTPPATAGAPLCGVIAPDVGGLRAKAGADPRFKAAGKDDRQETFSSEELQAIWTFVTPKHPAYPAAVCQQVIDRDGAMQIDRQIRCEASAKACEAFTAELDQMEDGSGDGL